MSRFLFVHYSPLPVVRHVIWVSCSMAKIGRNSLTTTVRVSLVGHSFIRRLRDAIRHKADLAFLDDFGLQNVRLDFVCKGGWKILDIQDNLPSIITQSPNIVLLQCGTNDLCSLSDPHTVADTILGTAKMIRDASHAHTVVVCQILHRNKVDTRYLTSVEELTKFNNNVDKANAFLKAVSAGYEGIKFWKHKGLCKKCDIFLCPDGVHLSAKGQFKYYKSLRGAVVYSIKHA